MKFVKMQGLGNDYIYTWAASEAEIPADLPGASRAVSNRHFGIGSDGLIVISPPSQGVSADVRMRMFNSDGSEGQMCGNGIRCVAKFVVDRGISAALPLRVETGRGVLAVEWRRGGDGRVASASVQMGEPVLACSRIPAHVPGVDPGGPVIEHGLLETFFTPVDGAWRAQCGLEPRLSLVSMGNPHAIFYVKDLSRVPLATVGPFVERHPWFPARINAHFVQVISNREVRVLTWERGAGATLACGTGASAICVAGVLGNRTGRSITAHLPGGDLQLEWPGAGHSVRMTGPAVQVFEGEIDLPSASRAAVEAGSCR